MILSSIDTMSVLRELCVVRVPLRGKVEKKRSTIARGCLPRCSIPVFSRTKKKEHSDDGVKIDRPLTELLLHLCLVFFFCSFDVLLSNGRARI